MPHPLISKQQWRKFTNDVKHVTHTVTQSANKQVFQPLEKKVIEPVWKDVVKPTLQIPSNISKEVIRDSEAIRKGIGFPIMFLAAGAVVMLFVMKK